MKYNFDENAVLKQALYHCDLGNVHRPTRREAEDNAYSCPRCKSQLINKKNRHNSLYVCSNDDCKFFIRKDQMFDKESAKETLTLHEVAKKVVKESQYVYIKQTKAKPEQYLLSEDRKSGYSIMDGVTANMLNRTLDVLKKQNPSLYAKVKKAPYHRVVDASWKSVK